MSPGQMEGLIGFLIGAGILAVICVASYWLGLLLEKIIEKLDEKGWKK